MAFYDLDIISLVWWSTVLSVWCGEANCTMYTRHKKLLQINWHSVEGVNIIQRIELYDNDNWFNF